MSVVTFNNSAHCQAILNQFRGYILMCVFHYFRTFSSFTVCIFRGVKNYGPGGWQRLSVRQSHG